VTPLFAWFAPGPVEITIIGIIAILLFGNRVPKLARSLGSSIVEFKKGISGVTEDTKEIVEELDSAGKAAKEAVDS